MAKKSLKTLCKEYEVENYFDVIIESYFNGHIAQTKTQYNNIKNKDKKDFINYLFDVQPNEVQNILNVVL